MAGITANDVQGNTALYYDTTNGGVQQTTIPQKAVYWIGQDGNIYYGSGQQGAAVQNLGSASNGQFLAKSDGLYDRYTDTGVPVLTYGATQISDPSAPSVAPSGGGGSGTTKPILNQGAVDNTQKAIDEIPGLLTAALASEKQNYDNTVNGFNAQEAAQQKTYDESTVTNQQNYDRNFMDSIRAGIKGLGGLFALLRGTGAGGGTAEQLARDTVSGVTAQDIRGGADTRDENQQVLDSGLSTFLTDLRGKRQANEDTYVNNQRAIRRDSNTNLQDLYGKMAGYYGDAGDTASRDSWMTKAGALTSPIAQDSRTQVSRYDTTPVSVKAPELAAFAEPTQPSVVSGGNRQIGSGIFTISDRKKEKEQSSVPVGA